MKDISSLFCRNVLSRVMFTVILGASFVNVSFASNGPCDLFRAATPCVAAFSTVRALYTSYSGSLYQVTRTSDGATTDVGVLSDGYANAATQDAFCLTTTCTISKIYDQSANKNDLTPAPPGGNNNQQDLGANASALPVMAGGHKVYGIYVTGEVKTVSPGVGYRRDLTTGPAKGANPEGVYMVGSSLPFNSGCCLDFGNAESDNMDHGTGTMDAININCQRNNPCTQTIGLDMEHGFVPTPEVPVAADLRFVTAMGWNDGKQPGYYDLYWGNAQSGGLTSPGKAALPFSMALQGGIVLGIGGDNSNTEAGYFFEGVMTTGTPSDSSMASVQANIVTVGYKFAGTLTVGPTYTFSNQQSGMALDTANNGAGAAVVQNPASGATSQQWMVQPTSNGYNKMVNVASGLCLEDPNGDGNPSRTSPGTLLWQQPCSGLDNQNWRFKTQSNSYYVIENEAASANNSVNGAGTPMAIDDYNGQATNGLQMWLTGANDLPPQNWLAASVSGTPAGTISDGSVYSFTNQQSQLLLANLGSLSSNAPIVQHTPLGTTGQQWMLHSQGSGYFTMVNVNSGYCLEDPYGNPLHSPTRDAPTSTNDSTMLWQVPCNGATPQNWKFIPQSNGTFVIENQGGTAKHGSSMVIDDYNGSSQLDLQMWLDTANGLPPQNWTVNKQSTP